ncbi:hypothetical protein VB712_03660 [Spirulina sp. CCNP1310]|uniref:hypothetical protein n=1 Tax=Spirulina sp. CCNP1310 TaxID=3110249 RepID=UPI002B1EB199|nr:hypothetical protein [Spirulina sp. CCNP1310]MEA5418308.1 hypothetical protein [Spirulina sp. CCNP1310]
MSDSVLILPSSYARNNDLDKQKLIDDTPYYKRTKELVSLLLEIGAVVINPSTGIIEFNPFTADNRHPNIFVSRLLGYVAEGIVVRNCNESLDKNRHWANIARVLKQENNNFSALKTIFFELLSITNNPDHYKAVGTGFAKTAKQYGHLYNPQSDRDICWIHGFHDARELLSVKGIKLNKQKHAGLQLKVSLSQQPSYVVNYFCKKPFFSIYPVVYFDLSNNFYVVREKILNIRTGIKESEKVSNDSILNPNIRFDGFSDYEIIDAMLIRGKDVDPSLHEELEYYKHTFNKLSLGKLDLLNLSDDNIIIPLIMEYLAVKNSRSNNSEPASIINLTT